ncbi:hypothetical protein [Actinoplanes palleronii]|nr:hypothetical protein [Actinoplanes palleronii]
MTDDGVMGLVRVASFADIPLAEVLPGEYHAVLGDLARIGSELDGRGACHWFPDHVAPPATAESNSDQPLISIDVSFAEPDDSIELGVVISWGGAAPLLTVWAFADVMCLCQTFHGVHSVRDDEWQAVNGRELVRGFRAAVRAISQLARTGPAAAGPWRVEAGLPGSPMEP